jgi:Spy/CpxP family protein refolding chaperone
MNIRKGLSLALLGAGIFLIGNSVQAQVGTPGAPATPTTPPPADVKKPHQHVTAKERLEELTKVLNLTDAQQGQVKDIWMAEAKDIKALRADKNATPADKKSKMQAIRVDAQKKIEGILNDEQKKKWADYRAEHSKKAKKGKLP